MKKLFAVSLFLGGFLLVSLAHADDLKQSRFTQVVNNVRIVSAANNEEKPAAVNDIFNMPDLVRTGEASRAELVAADDTITRVGANTVFSFDPANRTIDLQQGSLLFHSPKGKGGGTIHTNSATASVLGTTIIVTTTHNGGFKVIDLEGHVAIKFLSGIRQSLNPGQMTFVLPGGHPAPVLTIRLDTLTKNSHLVQGFAAPLPSMPLIQQQVDTQVKQIQSGQAEDTGLLVGDNATSSSVQVVTVNPNTITATQTTNGPAGSVTIATPTLDSSLVTFFSGNTGVPGTGIVTIGAFTAPASAPNIFINTPVIDLSPYTGQTSAFEFIAPGNITINESLTFNGHPANASSFLGFIAGDQLLITPGSTVEADVGEFLLTALGQNGMTLNGANIVNNDPTGTISIDAPSSLSISNGSTIQAQNNINLASNNDITITGSSVVANNNLDIDSLNGDVTINSPQMIGAQSLEVSAGDSIMVTSGGNGNGNGSNGNFQVGDVTLTAGNGITINGNSQTPSAGPLTTSFVFMMTAANFISVQNLDFGGFATVNMTAHTLNLTNADFANTSTVNLRSHSGLLNMGSSVPGDVNFISNVTYGGGPTAGHINFSTPVNGMINISGGAP
ncbi:MAG TPA: FecR family protein [Opitutaceae bacterium]|jgi:hypothetical protein|nr:FecR family protein [Opitutaceae bacterium]